MQMSVRSVRVLKAFAGARLSAGPRSARCDASSAALPQASEACRRVASGVSLSMLQAAMVFGLSSLMVGVSAPVFAQDGPSVTVGAGLRTSFVHTQNEDGDDEDGPDTSFDNFNVGNARLYVNGTVTKNIKLTFNTDYDSATNEVRLLDAVGQISFSPKANIWMGRFLPPSDRPNLYGPFYAHSWNVFTDGIQDSYPMIYQGRLNGVAYWGEFGKAHVSAGIFDGPSADFLGGNAGNYGGDSNDPIVAARFQYDFWDAESGYYQNSTYYGDKNVLAIGVAGQAQGEEHTAWSVDFLAEHKVGMGGAWTVEAEWARYSQLGLTFPPSDTTDGGFLLGSFLFPGSGPGHWEILGKYGSANLKGAGLKETLTTSEFNLNYILKQFNARIMMFFLDQRWELNESANSWKAGLGLQLQM